MATVTALGSSVTEPDTRYERLTFQMQLDEVSSEDVSVRYRILDGTAIDEEDRIYYYGGYSTGVERFRSGETVEEAIVYVRGDFEAEADESVTIELLKPVNADLGTTMLTQQTAAWILDDDGTANPTSLWISNPKVMEGNAGTTEITYQLQLSRPADRDYVFDWSLDGSATAGKDYTNGSGSVRIARGERDAEVTVNVRGDNLVETLEHIDLKVDLPNTIAQSTGGQATIIDDDAGQGPFIYADGRRVSEVDTGYTRLEYYVTLTEPSAEYVSVPWRLQNGTATIGVDTQYSTGGYVSGTLRFSPGELQETVTVYVAGDTLLEPDESFILELQQPTNARLAGNASILQTAGFIIDDDSIGDQSTLFISDAYVRETDTGRATADFQLELSRPADRDLVFRYNTVNGSAKAGVDYVGKAGSVTILKGHSTASIGVDILPDNGFEASETFRLDVRLPSSVASSTIGDGTILNDDLRTDFEFFRGRARSEDIRGTEFRDRMQGRDGDDRLFAFGGDDTLSGGNGNDLLVSGSGTDSLFGGAGNDRMRADRGNDIAKGGGGSDTIEGGKGQDRLFGEGGNDRLLGNDGVDVLNGGAGNDRAYGGARNDTIFLGAGNDLGVGGGGQDRIYGNAGKDRLVGGGSNDKLNGGGDDDVLLGGSGNDRLDGARGNDRLTGGGGRDEFVFRAGSGRDTVTDYNDRQDSIRIISGANSFRDLDISQRGDDVLIEIKGADILLLDTDKSDLNANDFLF